MQPNESKLSELILYISKQCESKPHFGKTVLYKLLYFSDFTAYWRLGQPITGVPYQKIEHGPAPKSRDRILDAMEDEGRLAFQKLPAGDFIRQKPVNLEEPDLSNFTGPEVALVNDMIVAYGNMTATKIEAVSHREPGWFLTDMFDIIPYQTALISREPFSREEQQRAAALAQKYRGRRA